MFCKHVICAVTSLNGPLLSLGATTSTSLCSKLIKKPSIASLEKGLREQQLTTYFWVEIIAERPMKKYCLVKAPFP